MLINEVIIRSHYKLTTVVITIVIRRCSLLDINLYMYTCMHVQCIRAAINSRMSDIIKLPYYHCTSIDYSVVCE